MPASKQLPRQLLKSVLNKSLRGMESKGFCLNVHAWATTYSEMNPQHNRVVMQQFMQIIRDINGAEFRHVSAHAENIEDVRLVLRGDIPALLNAVERELPTHHPALAALDWRALFDIKPDPSVEVVVTEPTEESSDSGGSSMSINELAK